VLIGLLSLLLAAGLVTRIAYADTNYTVQSGDSLISIAARYNTTVDAIVTANSLPSRTIYVGQVLRIPSSSTASAPANQPIPASGQYTVQPGDTLSGIALRFGTTTEALMRANNLASTTIYTGQVLSIVAPNAAPPSQPTGAPPQPNPDTYTVQSGDNLSKIGEHYGISWQKIFDANRDKLDNPDKIFPGQELKIPQE
jgi:putative chitinase